MKYIDLEFKNDLAYITIDKEKSLNALNIEVLKEFQHALEQVESEKSRLLFIAGAGDKAFVAGADIAQMKEFNSVEATNFSTLGHKVFSRLEGLRCPTIALVDGFALGGGFELALACDIILATTKSKFGLPEVSLGLIPGFGGTQRLSRSLGLHLAKSLTLTGEMVSADFLREKGLVFKTFETKEGLYAESEKMAAGLKLKGPRALAVAKSTIQKGYSLKKKEALELEKQEFALLFGTKECKEGIEAFLEKRKPEF